MLEDLLKRHAGVKADGDAMHVPDGTEVSLYVAMGIEPLVLDKITSLKFEAEAIVANTRRKEIYLIAYEDLRALRVHDDDAGRAGYG